MSRAGQEGPIPPFPEEGAGTKLGRPAGTRLLLCVGCFGKWTTPQVPLLPLMTMSGLHTPGGPGTDRQSQTGACVPSGMVL